MIACWASRRPIVASSFERVPSVFLTCLYVCVYNKARNRLSDVEFEWTVGEGVVKGEKINFFYPISFVPSPPLSFLSTIACLLRLLSSSLLSPAFRCWKLRDGGYDFDQEKYLALARQNRIYSAGYVFTTFFVLFYHLSSITTITFPLTSPYMLVHLTVPSTQFSNLNYSRCLYRGSRP